MHIKQQIYIQLSCINLPILTLWRGFLRFLPSQTHASLSRMQFAPVVSTFPHPNRSASHITREAPRAWAVAVNASPCYQHTVYRGGVSAGKYSQAKVSFLHSNVLLFSLDREIANTSIQYLSGVKDGKPPLIIHQRNGFSPTTPADITTPCISIFAAFRLSTSAWPGWWTMQMNKLPVLSS